MVSKQKQDKKDPETPSTRSGKRRGSPSPTKPSSQSATPVKKAPPKTPPKDVKESPVKETVETPTRGSKRLKKVAAEEDTGISPALLQAVSEVSNAPQSPKARGKKVKDVPAAPEIEIAEVQEEVITEVVDQPPTQPQEDMTDVQQQVSAIIAAEQVGGEENGLQLGDQLMGGQLETIEQPMQGTAAFLQATDGSCRIPVTLTDDGQIITTALPEGSQMASVEGTNMVMIYSADGTDMTTIPVNEKGESIQIGGAREMTDAEGNVILAQHHESGPQLGVETRENNENLLSSTADQDVGYGQQTNIQLCPICNDSNSGYHYGIYSCESCKGFFKRAIQNNRQLRCNFQGNCDVTPASRKRCAACRLRKCLLAGMKVEAIRADRRRGGRSIYIGTPPAPHYRPMRFMKTKSGLKAYRSDQLLQAEAQRLLHDVLCMESQLNDDAESETCCEGALTASDDNAASSLLHLAEHRLYRLIHWARQLPNFSAIETNDQIVLLQSCWASLLALCMCFQSIGRDHISLNYSKTVSRQLAEDLGLGEVYCRIENIASFFAGMGLSREEYVALRLLLLVNPDVESLSEREKTKEYQEQFSDMLMFHCITFRTLETHRYGSLMLRLAEITHIGALIQEWMLKTYDSYSEDNRPQLTGLLIELLKQETLRPGGAPGSSELEGGQDVANGGEVVTSETLVETVQTEGEEIQLHEEVVTVALPDLN